MKGDREKARGTRGGVAVYIWRQEVQFVRSLPEAEDEGWYKTRGRERASEREECGCFQACPRQRNLVLWHKRGANVFDRASVGGWKREMCWERGREPKAEISVLCECACLCLCWGEDKAMDASKEREKTGANECVKWKKRLGDEESKDQKRLRSLYHLLSPRSSFVPSHSSTENKSEVVDHAGERPAQWFGCWASLRFSLLGCGKNI